VLGYNETFGSLSILALDRIQQLEPGTFLFRENETYDFEEYFEDVIGVSLPEDQPVETVLLKIDNELWPYIESKPLHGSQRVKSRTSEGVVVELKVFVNYELRATLLSYLQGIKVLEPDSLKQNLVNTLQLGLAKYLP
jgi:predicted DNA-binding transcriptional regulator YafY